MTPTLEDRLIEWEERRERGEAVSAADLCADEPSLLPELSRLIGLLESAERLLDVSLTEPNAGATAPESSPRTRAALPGRIGRYEVRAELGRGATCVVYLARDPQLHREVALKVLHDETPLARQQQPALAARLGREARTLARLKHAHVVPIYEPGLAEGRPYFVLEYVRGGSLRDRMGELSEAGPRAYVPLLAQVARAVQYAHDNGVLHRDLKPANILLDECGRALVSDFGLAKLLAGVAPPDGDAADTAPFAQESADASTQLTAPGFQPGTPAYMAPEQYDPAFGDVGPATDVWALGAILYELLTGDKPFPGRSRAEVGAQVCAGRLVPPRRRRPGADRRLEAVALRCLRTDPRQRYRSAGGLAEDLAAWHSRRRRRLATAALVAGVAALAGVLALPWLRPASPEERYRRAASGRLAALKRNESANFVPAGPGAAPAYPVPAGAQGTTVGRTDEGLVIEGSAKCCLIELCPEVPLAHYRVRARLRVKKLTSPDGRWGVYVNHAPVNTDPGPQHYFEAAWYEDDAGLRPRSVRRDPPTVEAMMAVKWFSYHHTTPGRPDDVYPYRYYRHPIHPENPTAEAPVREGESGTSWRTIQVEVRAGEVSARCGGEGLARELDLGTIRAADRPAFFNELGVVFPDLRGINPRVSGTGAGVYVDSAVCDVSEFVIEPLAVP